MHDSRHPFVMVALLTALALNLNSPSQAMIVLDQEYDEDPSPARVGGISNLSGTFGRAQTFTVGIGGTLEAVEVTLVDDPVAMRILATDGEVPLGGSSGTIVLAFSNTFTQDGNTYRFDFASEGLVVSPGDVLAIDPVGAADFSLTWFYTVPGNYAGGRSFFYNTDFSINTWIPDDFDGFSPDFHFRTFVNAIPEPTSFMLAGVALMGMALPLARRRLSLRAKMA